MLWISIIKIRWSIDWLSIVHDCHTLTHMNNWILIMFMIFFLVCACDIWLAVNTCAFNAFNTCLKCFNKHFNYQFFALCIQSMHWNIEDNCTLRSKIDILGQFSILFLYYNDTSMFPHKYWIFSYCSSVWKRKEKFNRDLIGNCCNFANKSRCINNNKRCSGVAVINKNMKMTKSNR